MTKLFTFPTTFRHLNSIRIPYEFHLKTTWKRKFAWFSSGIFKWKLMEQSTWKFPLEEKPIDYNSTWNPLESSLLHLISTWRFASIPFANSFFQVETHGNSIQIFVSNNNVIPLENHLKPVEFHFKMKGPLLFANSFQVETYGNST